MKGKKLSPVVGVIADRLVTKLRKGSRAKEENLKVEPVV